MKTAKPIIELDNVSLRFRNERPQASLRAAVKNLLSHLREGEANRDRWFWALKDVSLKIFEGESVGLIGLNGASKSTLLQAIAGIYHPTSGEVTVRGRVTALLGINVGFVPNFSGRDNIMISGLLLGMTEPDIQAMTPEIINFAELEDAIDRPVKYYSSGMKSRLGFAIISALEPEMLLLDEVMSVGDASFRRRARDRMQQMLENARTIIICSHSVEVIRNQCDRTIWMDKGRLKAFGDTEQVLAEYEEFLESLPSSAVPKRTRKDAAHSKPRKRPAKQNSDLFQNELLD